MSLKTRKLFTMKENSLLAATSLLSALLTSVHIAGDVLYGFEKGGTPILVALPILAIWSYAALVLTDRKSGYIIIIVFSLLGLLVPIIHMRGAGLAKGIADTPGGLLFIWSTIALGVTSLFSIMLSMRGLLKRNG